MSPSLEEYLRWSVKLLAEVEDRAAEAVLGYNDAAVEVTDMQAYEYLLSEFSRYLEEKLLGISLDSGFGYDDYVKIARRHIQTTYRDNGWMRAYDLIRSGQINTVFAAMAHAVAEESGRNQIRYAVQQYWDHTETGNLIKDAREYVDQYRDLFPSTLSDSDTRIVTRFREVLEEHPFVVREHRRRFSRTKAEMKK